MSRFFLFFATSGAPTVTVDNQLITSDGDTFLTSDGDNFIVKAP